MKVPDVCAKIWSTDWKYLIVLDACRYDYFQKVYKEYISGNLEKVYSYSVWAERVLKSKHNDIVYVSANPNINSKGITIGKEFNFNPKRQVAKVIDVWDWGWNENLGVVPPAAVNKATLLGRKLYPNKRFIIHYMQPHYPYLCLSTKGIQISERDISEIAPSFPPFLERVRRWFRWRLVNLLGEERGFKIADRLTGPHHFCYAFLALAKKIGKEGLRHAYEENLRIVLGDVAKLIDDLHGKIVVTSDHGELLGEGGM